MRPEDRIRIRHLTEAATKAVAHSASRQQADLNDDELLRLGLTKLLEIVGEAAENVSPEARAALRMCRGGRPPVCATGSSTSTSTSMCCGRRH
jgi:uncharacterized protein with HEPN domain